MWSNEMKQVGNEATLELPPSIEEMHDLRELGIAEVHGDGSSSVMRTTRQQSRLDGIVIGTLVGLKDSGTPLIDFPANPTSYRVEARCTVALSAKDIGRKVALMFEGGSPGKPIVMGLLQHPEENLSVLPAISSNQPQNSLDVQVDGERLVVTAKQEIVLRCGKASITLTRAGKVLIHGEYVLSRSSGVNRIKGGSVQIN
jgi:Domain of unknown function (DUF6484)